MGIMLVKFHSQSLDIGLYLGSTNCEILSPNIKDSVLFTNKLTAMHFASKLESYMMSEFEVNGLATVEDIKL